MIEASLGKMPTTAWCQLRRRAAKAKKQKPWLHPPDGAERLRLQNPRAGGNPHPGHRRRTGSRHQPPHPHPRAGQAATIGLQLPAEVSAKKLYLELRDAATDLVLHRSPDLPVDLIG